MKVVTAFQMKQCVRNDISLNRYTRDDYVFAVAMALKNQITSRPFTKVAVLAGPGEDGDFGLALACLLKKDGFPFTINSVDSEKHDFLSHLIENDIEVESNLRLVKTNIEEADCIVDCLFGIESDGMIEYPYNYMIDWTNDAHGYVISCDIPSGCDSDDGTVFDRCINADLTVVLQLPKAGLYIYPASQHTGKIVIESVGISYDSVAAIDNRMNVSSYREAAHMVPNRISHSHKGDYGNVLLIAGSEGMPGAAILCGKAILRTGAGLLTVMSYKQVLFQLSSVLYEAKTISFEEDSLYRTMEENNLKDYDLVVIGPGLGRNRVTEALLNWVMRSEVSVVVDGDGLYYLAQNKDLMKRKALTVITPHLGEYKRIFSFEQSRIAEDLRIINRDYENMMVVLKSENTIIAYKGNITFNPVGNNALAKGGSGDVLAGAIAGMLAQRSCYESVVAAVYVHSLSADYWLQNHSSYSLLASDVIEMMDRILFEMSR